MASSDVTVTDEWVLGPGDTPFFTKRVSRLGRRSALRSTGSPLTSQWCPSNEEPKAYIVFMHGEPIRSARCYRFNPLNSNSHQASRSTQRGMTTSSATSPPPLPLSTSSRSISEATVVQATSRSGRTLPR